MFMLSGLLAPPSGPDLAFVQELLGAYAWMGLVLVVVTTLLRRASGFAVLITAPLLLTAGAWTYGMHGSILEAPVPTGIPAAGLRAWLMDAFWSWDSVNHALPNIHKPQFTLPYALTLVVLAHAAHAGRRSWLSITTLAALVGFLGLASTSLAPIGLVLWAGLEAVWLVQSGRAGSVQRSDVIRSVSGLALAAILLLAGSFSTYSLGDSVTSGLSLGWNEHRVGWQIFGTLDRLPDSVGLVGFGPLTVAVAALLLARRNRLVQALTAGTGLLLLASLSLRYEPFPPDMARIEGHARNLALFALLIALSVRLAGLRPARLRYAVGAPDLGLIVLPTVAAPVRNVGLALGNGVELANAQPPRKLRYALESLPSGRITAYIRNHTAVDARVFSPHPELNDVRHWPPQRGGVCGTCQSLLGRRSPI